VIQYEQTFLTASRPQDKLRSSKEGMIGMASNPTSAFDPTQWEGLLHSGIQGTFMRLPFVQADAHKLRGAGATVAFLGFPWDSTCISRTGTNYGPKSLREVSYQFQFFNATTGVDLTQAYTMVDCGDVPVLPGNSGTTMDSAQKMLDEILTAGAIPVMMGGDHSITIAGVRSFRSRFKRPGLINIDTHLDTAPQLGGELISHCCPLSRAVDAGFDPKRMVIIGANGWLNPRSELEYAQEKGITIISMDDVERMGAGAAARKAAKIASHDTDGLYLTIDIDALDAAFAPGCGVPTPGGLTSREMIRIVHEVSRFGLGAVDIVEVSPAWDKEGITSSIACRLILEALAGNLDAAARAR
jgi:agmatinase